MPESESPSPMSARYGHVTPLHVALCAPTKPAIHVLTHETDAVAAAKIRAEACLLHDKGHVQASRCQFAVVMLVLVVVTVDGHEVEVPAAVHAPVERPFLHPAVMGAVQATCDQVICIQGADLLRRPVHKVDKGDQIRIFGAAVAELAGPA